MRHAVIGCGSIGRRHIRTLLDLGHDVVAYNRGSERRRLAAKDFGISVFDDRDKMLRSANADTAIVASPTSLHVTDALAAAKTGHHLFVEKPLGADEFLIDDLEAIVSDKQLITHVGSNLRHLYGPRLIQDLLRDNVLGRPLCAQFSVGAYLPDWHPWEDHRSMYSAKKELGGGVLLDSIHEIDLSLWYFGMPKSVACMFGNSRSLDIETEDIADVILEHSDSFTSIHLDYLQRPMQRWFRIVGEKGMAYWNWYLDGVELVRTESQEKEWFPEPDGYTRERMYVEQMKYFLSCVCEGTESDANLKAGRAALRTVLACKESNNRRRFVDVVPVR